MSNNRLTVFIAGWRHALRNEWYFINSKTEASCQLRMLTYVDLGSSIQAPEHHTLA